MVISAGVRGIQLAKRIYDYGKPVVTGKSFVSKFPPQHRKTVQTILTASERAFTGGLVADIIQSFNNENFGVPSSGIPEKFRSFKKTNRFNKKRGRHFKRSTRFDKHKATTTCCYCR